MNVKLLLALVVLMEPLRDVFGDANIRVGQVADRKARLSKVRSQSRSSGSSVLPGLGQVEAKTKDIIAHTEKLVDLMTANSQRQDFFFDLSEKVAQSQEVLKQSLKSVIKVSTTAKDNTAQIKTNQDSLLKIQQIIFDLISTQNTKTRTDITQTEKVLASGLEKVLNTQVQIVSSLQKSEDAIAAGFNTVEKAERRTQSLNSQVLQAVAESAAANAQGQANITAELKETRQETVEALDKAISRQKSILELIATAESSELAKLDIVQGNQLDLLRLIRESQQVVQQSIREAINNEIDTQGLVTQTQQAIQQELDEHKKHQGNTQHLAKKCLENTKCDLDKVNHLLVQLSKLNDAVHNDISKGLKEIRNKQSATQVRVNSAEKTILQAFSSGFNDINSGVSFLSERLASSESQIQASFNAIGSNIRDTRNSQDNVHKHIDEIHHFLDKVLKH